MVLVKKTRKRYARGAVTTRAGERFQLKSLDLGEVTSIHALYNP